MIKLPTAWPAPPLGARCGAVVGDRWDPDGIPLLESCPNKAVETVYCRESTSAEPSPTWLCRKCVIRMSDQFVRRPKV